MGIQSVVSVRGDIKSQKCILIGYTFTGYRLWDIEKEKIIVAKMYFLMKKNFYLNIIIFSKAFLLKK
jgi:hypothetical protein